MTYNGISHVIRTLFVDNVVRKYREVWCMCVLRYYNRTRCKKLRLKQLSAASVYVSVLDRCMDVFIVF